MKGKRNVVFVYVRAIGIPEHRAVMEAAFVYGSIYQFVLTTEAALLEDVSSVKSDDVPAKLIYCHCKSVTSPTQGCQRTLSEQPLSTLSIHRFLKLMNAPLVTEASGDPEKYTSVQLQLGLPMVFIVGQQDTYEDDRVTAEHVAWQLLGKAGVAILTRETSGAHIPPNTNVAVKSADENEPVLYLLLGDAQEIIDLVENNGKNQYKEDSEMHIQSDPEVQDDEVAEAVYRDRKRVLPLDSVPSLTEEAFTLAVTGKPRSVILFYAGWEAVSLTFLQSFLEMAGKYKDALGVYLGRVNCAEMNDICNQQNVTSIPAATIYQAGRDPLVYTGALGSEDLARFILLSALDCPLYLHTREDAEHFLSGVELPYPHLSALGVVAPDMKAAADALIETEDASEVLSPWVSTPGKAPPPCEYHVEWSLHVHSFRGHTACTSMATASPMLETPILSTICRGKNFPVHRVAAKSKASRSSTARVIKPHCKVG
uniref:Thioredoxin domain-containing protein n=1 Tax=Leptobrachium leishanense TaxID=445787 RepID=A0A8C5QJT8_9ANUR